MKLRINLLPLCYFLLFVSLMINGRLRLDSSAPFHFGGAEFAISPFDIPLLGIFILTIISSLWKENDIAFRFDALDMSLAAYLCILLVTTVFSESLDFSLYELIRQIKLFLLYLFAKTFFSKQIGFSTLIISISFIVLIQGIVGYFQYFTGQTISGLNAEVSDLNEIASGVYRVAGTFGHPGILSQFLNSILGVLLVASFNYKGYKKNIILVFYMLGGVIILTSLARTGIAMFGIILFLTILLNTKLNAYKLGKAKKVLLILGPVIIFIGLIIAFFDVIILRFTTAQDVSLNIRFYLADIAFNMIENNPLTGVGLNAFTNVMKHYDHTGVSGYFMFPVHNIYLLTAAETGLFGLLAFIIVMCVFLYTGIQIVRKGKVLLARQIAFCAVSGLVVIYLSGLLGWSWRLDCLQVVFYLLLALVASAKKVEREFEVSNGHNNYSV